MVSKCPATSQQLSSHWSPTVQPCTKVEPQNLFHMLYKFFYENTLWAMPNL